MSAAEIHRLNVKSSKKKSVIYVGYHLASATFENGEIMDVVGSGNGIAIETGKERDHATLFISYEDLIKEAAKVL